MIKQEVNARLENKIHGWYEKNPKRVYFTVSRDDLVEVAGVLYKEYGMRLSTVSGVDNENNFELIYHFGYDKTGEMFNMRVFIEDKSTPQVDSLTGLFKSTDWVEREIHEMLGIDFKGHPNLIPLLLEDWPEGEYPLRKSCTLDKESYPLKEES